MRKKDRQKKEYEALEKRVSRLEGNPIPPDPPEEPTLEERISRLERAEPQGYSIPGF